MYSNSTFYAQNPALEIVDQQKSVNVYLRIHIERECSEEEPFMRSILCHNIYPRSKFNNLTNTPMYSSRLYAKNTVFEIVHEESVKVYHLIYTCTTGIFSRPPYAQNPVCHSRNFTSLPGSRLRFFIAMQCVARHL